MTQVKIGQQLFLLRKQKGVTQNEFAKVAGVTKQAVSKWEAGVCCPDIQQLPNIAKYFGVSMDTLFGLTDDIEVSNKNMQNGELTTRCSDETVLASYERKIADGQAQSKELLAYAELLDKFAFDYFKKAEAWYQKTIALTQTEQSEEYFQAQKKLMLMLCRMGKSEACIQQCRQQLSENEKVWWNYYLLALACKEGDRMQEAWEVLQKALVKFEGNVLVYELAGEICRALEWHEEAFSFWTKAYEADSKKCSALYSKAYLYEKLAKYEKAVQTWEEIIKWHHEHRLDENHELDWPLVKIENLRKYVNR